MLTSARTEEAAATLGASVRALRRERGLTLKQLGRDAGLSHPFLSQLERGLARPSLASIERIAHALEVPVGSLWAAPARRRRAQPVPRDGGSLRDHADPAAPGALRTLTPGGGPLVVREWTGGSRRWPERPDVEPGEILVYVARGGVEVDVDGDVHALGEGDALIFDGAVPHRVRRTGGAGTRALCVASPVPPA